ncbi:RNA-dependent RNA polymerase [Kudzu virus D]|nr:RNA-dependent RNA polymerase [Kudzu virus D]
MALFDYRTPAETALTRFSSEEQSRISNSAVGKLADLESKSSQHFSYAMKSWARRRLTEAGCYLSVHSFIPHSHPVCKTIENHILLNVLPGMLSADFLVVSMKRNKLAWLRHRSGFDMLSLCNRFVSSKDPFRYGLDRYFEEAKQRISDGMPVNSEPDTLKDLVPQALRKKNKRFLLHDEIHYWSLDDLNNFLVLTKPEVVIATHVFPKEILAGSEVSLNPWAYTFRIQEKKLLFYPDGVLEEGYEQPLSGAFILTMGKFLTSEGDIYSIDVSYSLFTHSVITITKGKLLIPKHRSFSRFDATCGEDLDHFGGTSSSILRVRPEFLKNLYLYLHTLKKPDKQSAVAKLRQMCPDPSGYEIRFIEDFAQFILEVDPTGDMIRQSLLHRLHKFILRWQPDFFRRNSKTFQEMSLSSFIENIQEFSVNVRVVDCYEHRFYHQIIGERFKKFYNLLIGDPDDLSKDIQVQARLLKGRAHQCYQWVCSKKKGEFKIDICKYVRRSRFDCPIFTLFHSKDKDFCLKMTNSPLPLLQNEELVKLWLPFGIEFIRLLETVGRQGFYRLCKQVFNEFFRSVNLDSSEKPLIGWIEEVDIIGGISDGLADLIPDGQHSESTNNGEDQFDCPQGLEEDLASDLFLETGESLPDTDDCKSSSDPEANLEDLALDSSSEPEGLVLFDVSISIDQEAFTSLRPGLNKIEVKGDGNCFWHCLSARFGGDYKKIKSNCLNFFKVNYAHLVDDDVSSRIEEAFTENAWAENEVIALASSFLKCKILVFSEEFEICQVYSPISECLSEICISHQSGHFTLLFQRNVCVLRSIADALNREDHEVLRVVSQRNLQHILEAINEGNGLPGEYLDELFNVFSINAHIHEDGSVREINEEGTIVRHFELSGQHLTFLKDFRNDSKLDLARKGPLTKPLVLTNDQIVKKLKVKGLSYKPSLDRALNPQESFLEGFTGKILSRVFGNRKEWISAETKSNLETQIHPFVGTFGSGKSFTIKKIIRENPYSKFLIISPRKALAEAFKSELLEESPTFERLAKEKPFTSKGFKEKGEFLKSKRNSIRNVRIETFEVALTKQIEKDVLVLIDETQLFPPGYIDLLVIYNTIDRLVMLGDPAQSSYDSETDRFKFIGMNNDLVHILEGKGYQYLSLSKRFSNPFFLNRLPCSFEIKGKSEEVAYFIHKGLRHEIEMIYSYDAILVPSFEDKKLLSLMFKKKQVEVYTYGESTGLTFNKGAVLLNDATRKVGDERILVALSRFRHEINFINASDCSFEDFIQSCNGHILINFCTKRACLDDLKILLPGEPCFVRSFNLIGKDEVDREERLEGDPWLKTMINLGAREEPGEFENVPMIEPVNEIMKSHQPIHTIQSVRAGLCDKFKERMGREMRIKDLITDQFRDSYFSKDVRQTSNQCELFEAIYPRHKNSDTATFLMAVQKRLSFDTPEANMANYRKSSTSGKIMLEVFKQFVPINPCRNQLMLEEAQNEFEVKKLSKPKAVIENHSGRSSADWNVCEAFVFMKSQLCTKYEKRFCDAKAGQTLACFSHIVLCRFAPWIRYIEKKVNEVLPHNYYIHNGKNFDQLNDFVLQKGFIEECTESDYEAFDASQDVNIMSFEVELMKYLEIPEDVISDYIFIKVNLFSKLGHFSVMRFTGEAGTFLFNTLANMVFTFMRYDLSGKESICFAGDDMCANRPLRVKHEFSDLLNKLKLKAKVDIKREATFCGWVLTKDGIYKKPQLVLERFEISKERGTYFDCLENYAIEVSYAYRMSERGLLIMSEEEQESQQLCVREVVKHKKHLKSWVAEIFESIM